MTRLSASTENDRSCVNNAVNRDSLKDGCHRVSMTNMELARAADASFALHRSEESFNNVATKGNPLNVRKTATGGVRFNLRKRSVDRREVMSSYNSEFLTGLFADIESSHDNANDESDPRQNEGFSVKKSRVSMTRSISRCRQSYHSLAEVVSPPDSPVQFFDRPVITVHNVNSTSGEQPVEHAISRENSLSYQLNCVSDSTSDETKASTTDLCKLAFPHLPATVSDQDLTQMLPSRQSSDTPKETYGWFVEMDVEDIDTDTNAYKTSSKDDLAFSAPTAPKATHHDDQVEWAKAADTVDDVLGDFF